MTAKKIFILIGYYLSDSFLALNCHRPEDFSIFDRKCYLLCLNKKTYAKRY
ncbi:hypothetical protein PITCH_A380004 [uncultured Desulfobacterium sp.]|uniref:Uncharacterized protein n=1 Tax=uncultured Desulfobacterium sp. TaxID=201089 RepID=A0A445MZM8_9BACT|nr:hypothetical protein PITCH_A380004 [uncultured Desulfobacterium sp.]